MEWVQAQDTRQAVEMSRWRKGPVSAGCDLKIAHYLNTGLEKTLPAGKTFTFLSIHFKELKLIKPVLQNLMRGRPVAVIPRYPSQFYSCFRLLAPLGFARFSRGARDGHVLVDAMGETARFLRRSRCCFVGGSLVARGGHNCWEPFLAGVPVLIGSWHFNQRELVDNLCRAGLARIVRFPEDFNKEWPPMLPEKKEALLEMYRQRLNAAMGQIREKLMALSIAVSQRQEG
jgi:3-deoxy-D-manno-octulosonic-acid transferase